MRAGRLLPLVALAFAAAPHARAADATGTWVLASSDLTYAVSHPLHHVEGTSRAAKGKGVCAASGGRFLVAVPVKTFDSGDSNRDLHMLEVTRGGANPMITVRVTVPGDFTAGAPAALKADAVVTFAGFTTTYTGVALTVSATGDGALEVRGTLPLTLTDFRLEAPSLLGLPIKNEIPVTLITVWKRPG